jgi:succinate dehydrogenase / fumarate reductase membrane anchor subunit
MSLRNPLATARGLGSAKNGTGHWWFQRLSALALLLLTPWFLFLVLGLVGADQVDTRSVLAEPATAALLLAFVLSLFWHAQLGLQVVIEDYVHGWLELALQVVVKFACAFAAMACVIAIGRIAFTA